MAHHIEVYRAGNHRKPAEFVGKFDTEGEAVDGAQAHAKRLGGRIDYFLIKCSRVRVGSLAYNDGDICR